MCVYITIMLRIINKASYKILHLLDSGRKGELQSILFLLTLTVIGMGYSKIRNGNSGHCCYRRLRKFRRV